MNYEYKMPKVLYKRISCIASEMSNKYSYS